MDRKTLRFSLLVVLAGAAVVLSACVTGYGRLEPDIQVSKTFESLDVPGDYSYYYSGPDAQPTVILGIKPGYTLESSVWKPVDLTRERLSGWMDLMTRHLGTSAGFRGAKVLDSSGNQVGIWYSKVYNTTVKVDGKTVRVHLPEFSGNGGGNADADWGTKFEDPVSPPVILPGGSMSK